MSGSKEGSKKAVATILAKNPNFFKEIGRIGGRVITDKKKGFAADPERARRAGSIGGSKSSRKGIKNKKGKK